MPKTPNIVGDIDRSVQGIVEIFTQQCKHGAQTESLPPEMATCGQFIGDEARNIAQHGLHGIAAALRVLGTQSSEECRLLVTRLVTYCEVLFEIHPSLTLTPEQRVGDTDNVIKLGELLYGLSFVSAVHAEQNKLARHIADKLQRSLIDGRAWGYFIGDAKAQLLPTAYALRGLSRHNCDITAPRKYILDHLDKSRHTHDASPADMTTAVACAYCLTFSGDATPHEETVSQIFQSAWRALEPLLDEDVEQNLEYWHGKDTHCVRVPWQLYLLALASEHSLWRFASFRAQRRLGAILLALQQAGFRYPYSGRYMSSRTYAIAFDVLDAIRKRTRKLTRLQVAYGLDRIRTFVGAGWVRGAAAVVAIGLIAYSTFQWQKTGNLAELAPDFIANVVVLLLASARRQS